MTRETRNHLVWISLLWVVFSLIGEWLVQVAIDQWPLIGSNEGLVTSDAIFILFRATVPVFTAVVLILAYSAIRFRVPQDDTAPADAQYGTGRLFIFGWVGLSVIINIIFIFYPGISGLTLLWDEARAAAAADPLNIEVTGKQWEWDFSYADYKFSTINDLVVPVGRPVKFVLKTDDVMHSFWVPAWGVKKALIPGETRTMFITPTIEVSTAEDPTARVQCAQICGIGHPVMRSGLRVVSKDEFASWVEEQKQAAAEESMNMDGMDMSGNNAGTMDMSGEGSGSMDMTNDSGGTMDMSGDNASGMDMSAPDTSAGDMTMQNPDSQPMDMSGTSDSTNAQ